MYRPDDLSAPQYPIFEKINGRIFPAFSGKAIMVIITLCLVAFGLNHLFATWVHDVTSPLSDSERADQLSKLQTARSVSTYDDLMSSLELLGNADLTAPKDNATDDERETFYELVAERAAYNTLINGRSSAELAELRKTADTYSITAATSDEELERLVPTTKVETVRVVGTIPGLMICLFVVLIPAAMMAEPGGSASFLTKLIEQIQFSRKQHEHLYSRLTGVW